MKIQTQHPEWYRVGYLYTSQETDVIFVVDAIEAYHTGLSFPIYFLNCHATPNTMFSRQFAEWWRVQLFRLGFRR